MPTAAEYREQLKALLPPGQAFPRDPGTTLHDLLDGMSIELRVSMGEPVFFHKRQTRLRR